MTDFWLQVLSGVLSALLTAIPVAFMSTWAQARARPERVTNRRTVATQTVYVPTRTIVTERRSTHAASSSESDSWTAVLIAALALVAAWFFSQHPVLVGASLIGLAAGCVAGLAMVWWQSLSSSRRVPPNATVPTALVCIVAAELVFTVIVLTQVRLHGATVWQMGRLLHTSGDGTEAPFVQHLLTQYGTLVHQYGLPSLMVLIYAVAITFACVIGVLTVAVTLFDWACYIAWMNATAGPLATRRGSGYLQHRWGARLASTLIPAMLIALFLLMPGFVEQQNTMFPTTTHSPTPSATPAAVG